MPRETRVAADLPDDRRAELLATQRRAASAAAIETDKFPSETDIAQRIDAVFADHTVAQRALLTRVVRLVFHLARVIGLDR